MERRRASSVLRAGLLAAGLALPVAFIALAVFASACGSNGGSASGASESSSSSGGPTSPPPDASVVGQLDGSPANTGLPALPELTNVFATEREDSVGIDFDPFDGAVDYRVYPLPSEGDVSVNANGSLTIKDAIYRCAGLRQTYDLPNNTTNDLNDPDAGQLYENPNPQYSWTAQIPATPTLGYVHVTAGEGRVPVYAVGVHPTSPELGWRETRPKIYTTDPSTRASLLAAGGRDDGIVFYVPATASSSTESVYHSETAVPVAGQDWTQFTEYYFTSADLGAHAGDSTPPAVAFQVLAASAADTQALMAVLYQPAQNHVELAVGNERWKRAANQGPGPLWHLEWSGITGPTTLVVEALASGCPFQGFLAPQGVNAPPHQPLDTLAQLQMASATGEVFINGQFDVAGSSWPVLGGVADAGFPGLVTPSASPVPVARSFVQVKPVPHDPAAWDWYEGFNVGTTFGAVSVATDPLCPCQKPGTTTACESSGSACAFLTSSTLDVGAYEVDMPNGQALFAYGQILGQFWDAFDDVGQDVTGTLRFTAPRQASVSATDFVHVTWSVNTVGTDRRYPQLIVTDQPAPVQDGFARTDSNFLLLQTRLGPSMRLEAQAFHGLVNGKPWAVNNQATTHAIIDVDGWPSEPTAIVTLGDAGPSIPPADPPFEHAGMDRMTRYDAFISAKRVYVFMDGAPAGCMEAPANGYALEGAVTVTFGDVLYHEGAQDELVCAQERPYPFLHEHQCAETTRHWDDLGFKSGVAPPAWDATRFPCLPY